MTYSLKFKQMNCLSTKRVVLWHNGYNSSITLKSHTSLHTKWLQSQLELVKYKTFTCWPSSNNYKNRDTPAHTYITNNVLKKCFRYRLHNHFSLSVNSCFKNSSILKITEERKENSRIQNFSILFYILNRTDGKVCHWISHFMKTMFFINDSHFKLSLITLITCSSIMGSSHTFTNYYAYDSC